MKSIIAVVVVLSSLPALAEPAPVGSDATVSLVPNVQELTAARHQQLVGRNLVVAAAIMQGVGLGLSGISATGVWGNRDAFIAVNGVTTILGFTSLLLIPAGIVYWTRGARHERLGLIGTTIAPDRAAHYERAGTVLLYVAGALGTASTVLAVLDLYGNQSGILDGTIATFVGGAALTAVGAPLAIAGHRHAHVQLGVGSVRGTF